jgi:hypothetical protein
MNKMNIYVKNERKCADLIQSLRNTIVFYTSILLTGLELPTPVLEVEYSSQLGAFL